MRLSTEEISDYIKCPLYYKFVHIDKLPLTRTLDDYYKEYIKLSIFFYYFSLIEKKTKSFETILRKWESLWFSDKMMDSFMEDQIRKKSNEGVMLLSSFYKKVEKETAVPIAVNFPYEIIFKGEENLHVTGEIDLIKIVNDRTRQRETNIVFLCMSHRHMSDIRVKTHLRLTLASYAFRENFKEKEDRIILDHILNKGDNESTRTGNDFSRAEKVIRNIDRGIKNKAFY